MSDYRTHLEEHYHPALARLQRALIQREEALVRIQRSLAPTPKPWTLDNLVRRVGSVDYLATEMIEADRNAYAAEKEVIGLWEMAPEEVRKRLPTTVDMTAGTYKVVTWNAQSEFIHIEYVKGLAQALTSGRKLEPGQVATVRREDEREIACFRRNADGTYPPGDEP